MNERRDTRRQSTQPTRITDRKYFIQLARTLGVRSDWHEPDEQNVTARVSGTRFDNAGFWPHPESYSPPTTVEQYVTIVRDGVEVAHVNLATLCAWASDATWVNDDSESYWRAKIADEIRIFAERVRNECVTKSTGIALAALVESAADQIDTQHTRAGDVTRLVSASSAAGVDVRPTQQEFLSSLTDDESWAHCGSARPHSSHTHNITFNEGTYYDVQCVGTPVLRANHTVTPPPTIDV